MQAQGSGRLSPDKLAELVAVQDALLDGFDACRERGRALSDAQRFDVLSSVLFALRRREALPACEATDYGVFVCETCRDNPSETCNDFCGDEWADELPSLADDFWPVCRCCRSWAYLVAPLVRA